MQLHRRIGFLRGYLHKQADSEFLKATAQMLGTTAETLRTMLLAGPPAAGALLGGIMSRATSPTNVDLKNVQKSLVDERLGQELAIMQRSIQLRKKRKKDKDANELRRRKTRDLLV